MKHILASLLATCSVGMTSMNAVAAEPPVIPVPKSSKSLSGAPVQLSPNTPIYYRGKNAKAVAELLSTSLKAQTGIQTRVTELQGEATKGITLQINPKHPDNNPEAYALKSEKGLIQIMAPESAGLFYGSQTLLQLIPDGKPQVAPVLITDAPNYPWRGMMLDVSRYFFTKEYVLRYLDMMAMHKMNTLHWHLIDDAGWRIEIKKYPKLTEIGAWRGKGDKRYGGFYTQEDIKEIVAYASARNITIVPEIELPAHTLPALVAYPHLGCFNKQFEVPTRHFISQDLYCPGKETTWTFLEDVFNEVCDLFPGTFIHIGGDEAKYSRWKKCPDCQKAIKDNQLKNEHALQGWMTTRVENYLAKKNKRIIGWDEILGAGVSNKAGIMTWHKPRTAVDGAKRGNPVVMSLTGHAYFDVAESKLEGEPPTAGWIPPISLKKAYQWEPAPKELKGTPAAKNILGASGCVWTDQFLHRAHILADKPGKGTSASEGYVDYLSLPRMAALAEVTWSPQGKRDYARFSERMKPMYQRYDRLGYQYRVPVPDVQIQRTPEKTYKLSATPPVAGGTIRYTTDGSKPTANSKVMHGSVTVSKVHDFRAATFTAGDKRQSLLFEYADPNNKFAKFGKLVGKWESGKVGNGKAKEVIFDATGLINSNGTYIITFQYTGGRERLDIDGIEVVRNDTVHVGKDIHHGFTGGSSKNNRYTIKVGNYETGASFKIKAQIYGDVGDDSNGMVLIQKKK
ncbi:family 20 glycosylhydrolase [Verrucomicrobiaceae bacterium N1E253]|uniref:beta-N-acetylhexosaminidase n=1 Tax=Oceaniferula marina TaxID=2748318 RepID=A0A851GFX6_9BACT|nr:family 20 glycosylhydrolase [Oceaniferula marina]NWK55812.1 family 20 glycosylhydrolase [Oceaniferula marina]